MLTGLQEEIDNWPELATAGRELVIQTLNADGSASTETWVVSDVPKKLNRITMLGKVSQSSLQAIADFKDTTTGKAFRLLLESGEIYDFAHPTTRAMTQSLADNSIITQTEADALLRVGERKQSRAEELFGRKIVEGDFDNA